MDIEATARELAEGLGYNLESACDLMQMLITEIRGHRQTPPNIVDVADDFDGWEIHVDMPRWTNACVPWDGTFDTTRECFWDITGGTMAWDFYATHPSLTCGMWSESLPEHMRPSLIRLMRHKGLHVL